MKKSQGLIQTGVQYKRSSSDRTIISLDLPANWTAEDVSKYGCSVSESRIDVVVTCWHIGRIVCVYRNGRIV